ncbi:hypothetical protein GF327_07810 [Candidatus Woesearchaeota archaeon]|nr:hypothetical protein [Candidatus Woesearchaeota archaeon]
MFPTNVKVVETTGAGDCFAASFLSGTLRNKKIDFCLKLAQANSETLIMHPGAKNKLLTYRQALHVIQKKKYIKNHNTWHNGFTQ